MFSSESILVAEDKIATDALHVIRTPKGATVRPGPCEDGPFRNSAYINKHNYTAKAFIPGPCQEIVSIPPAFRFTELDSEDIESRSFGFRL